MPIRGRALQGDTDRRPFPRQLGRIPVDLVEHKRAAVGDLPQHLDETGQIEEAVRRTMRVTGSALFFTTLVLCTGFLVMALRGTMKNTVAFGGLTALGIGIAFLADIIITPALLTVSRGLVRRGQSAVPDGSPISAPRAGDA